MNRMSEREAAVELPFAADGCPWVGKLRTVLPLTVEIRESAVQLVSIGVWGEGSLTGPLPLRDESRLCPLHDGTCTGGYALRRWGVGFVHRSRAVFCRAVPNPNVTIRNFCVAVGEPPPAGQRHLQAPQPLPHRRRSLHAAGPLCCGAGAGPAGCGAAHAVLRVLLHDHAVHRGAHVHVPGEPDAGQAVLRTHQ
jgi:hypothetical protein